MIVDSIEGRLTYQLDRVNDAFLSSAMSHLSSSIIELESPVMYGERKEWEEFLAAFTMMIYRIMGAEKRNKLIKENFTKPLLPSNFCWYNS